MTSQSSGSSAPRVGLTLPSFNPDPDVALAIARSADRLGIDSVFAYDHKFRLAPNGARRPALECFALLSAVAMATSEITIGSLVARSSLRAPKLLAQSFATLHSIAGNRIIAALGAGDRESRVENVSFGIGFASLDTRLAELRASVESCVAQEIPVWVGGTHPRVIALAAQSGAAAWNRWGGTIAQFRDQIEVLRSAERVARRGADGSDTNDEVGVSWPGSIAATWGGLIVIGPTNEAANDKARRLQAPSEALVGGPHEIAQQLRPYLDAGATWVVLAPVDASNVDNVDLISDVQALLTA